MFGMQSDAHLSSPIFHAICGIDEAGRGPLAGPVCAAAVILPLDYENSAIQDSKILNAKTREILFDEIIEHAIAYSIVFVSNKVIDQINILKATQKAMTSAIKNLQLQPDLLLIDGLSLNIPEIPQIQMIHGDQRSQSIAAASILAKVKRDKLMSEFDIKYPEYGFAQHKGYGTEFHRNAIKQHGLCAIHRKTFISADRYQE